MGKFIQRFLNSGLRLANRFLNSELNKICILIFAFIFGLGIFNAHSIVFLIVGTIYVILLLLTKSKIIRKEIMLVVAFGIIFFIFYSINEGFAIKEMLYYVILIPVAFVFGYYFHCLCKDDKGSYFGKWLLYLFFGVLIRWFFSFLLTGMYYGFISGSRRFVDIWYPATSTLNATGFMNYSIIVFPIAFFYFIENAKSRKTVYSLILVGLIILSIFVETLIGNRSFFFLVGVIALYYLIKLYKYILEKSEKLFLIVFISTFATLVFVSILLALDVGGLFSILSRVPVFKRLLSFFEDDSTISRYLILKDFLSTFYKHPFGGFFDGYVHNNFLDIYSYGGVIPALIFIAIFSLVIYVAFFQRKTSYLLNKKTLNITRILLLSITTLFMFEPVIVSSIQVLTIFFLLGGYILQTNYEHRILTERVSYKELQI